MAETITLELIYGMLKKIQDDMAHIRQQLDKRTEADPEKPIQVTDKATGVSTGLSESAAAILDGIAKPAESFTKGNADMFGRVGPAPPPQIRRRERGPTPDQIRDAERALTNINQSIKRGNDIDAADLRNLPKSQLERIRDGGDEYLQRLMQRWEYEKLERGVHERRRELGLD